MNDRDKVIAIGVGFMAVLVIVFALLAWWAFSWSTHTLVWLWFLFALLAGVRGGVIGLNKGAKEL